MADIDIIICSTESLGLEDTFCTLARCRNWISRDFHDRRKKSLFSANGQFRLNFENLIFFCEIWNFGNFLNWVDACSQPRTCSGTFYLRSKARVMVFRSHIEHRRLVISREMWAGFKIHQLDPKKVVMATAAIFGENYPIFCPTFGASISTTIEPFAKIRWEIQKKHVCSFWSHIESLQTGSMVVDIDAPKVGQNIG